VRRDGHRVVDWAACTSPHRAPLTREPDARYTFAVRASDEAGNTGAAALSEYRLTTEETPATANTTEEAPVAASPASQQPESTSAASAPPPRRGTTPQGSREPASAGTRGRRSLDGAARSDAARRAGETEPHGSRDARRARPRGTVAAVVDTVVGAAKRAADVAVENADESAFPLTLILLVSGFLTVQGRIDRRDPKLALAPASADVEVPYGPPLTERRVENFNPLPITES
jgi:hypothetical protein